MLGRLCSSSPDSRGEILGLDPTHRPLTLAPASGPAGRSSQSIPGAFPQETLAQPRAVEPPPLARCSEGPSASTPSSPGHLEPAPCHLPGLSLGLPGPPGVLTRVEALLPDYFSPPGLYRASFDKRPPSQLHSQGFPRNCTQPLLNWAPHPIRAPLLTQQTSPHSEILLFSRESSGPLERAPSPPTSQGALTCSRGSRFHPIYPCGDQAAWRLWSPA